MFFPSLGVDNVFSVARTMFFPLAVSSARMSSPLFGLLPSPSSIAAPIAGGNTVDTRRRQEFPPLWATPFSSTKLVTRRPDGDVELGGACGRGESRGRTGAGRPRRGGGVADEVRGDLFKVAGTCSSGRILLRRRSISGSLFRRNHSKNRSQG